MEEQTHMPATENVELQNNAPEANTEIKEVEQPAAVEQEAHETVTPVEPEADYSAFTREQLLTTLDELLNEEVTLIKNRVSQIKMRFNDLTREMQQEAFNKFLQEGGNKEEYQQQDDELSKKFFKSYGIYRERRQKHLDEIEAIKQQNLEKKREVLEELRKLVDSDEESMKKIHDEFNILQDRWKAIGDIPRDQVNDIWQNYHFMIEQFFNKVRMSRELKQLDLKRNLEQKIQLCEKTEELLMESSISKAFKQLQEYRAQWKEIGPVPMEQNEEIWQRFCNAANQIDEHRKELYEQRKEELEKNLLAKQALVEKVTELTEHTPQNIKEWNEHTDQLDEMLKVWKTIGPVPREVNDEIWAKFKGMIDAFYTRKKEYFNQLRDEQTENYNKKIELCLKAEAITKREDWKKATDELLDLQKQWKEIGSVSRKFSDKIWTRFRGACDEFFAKKAEFYKDIHGAEAENLEKKEAILAELKSYNFGDDKEANLDAIKDFQRRWAEIGFVPIKDKDRLQKDFRDTINKYFEQLRITAREAEETAYRERLRNVTAGDTKKFINSEKEDLLNKIQKFRNDINLWENNLGFLANSKQADLLKQEFEKKMQGARQQIALLEAKLRILNETKKDNEE